MSLERLKGVDLARKYQAVLTAAAIEKGDCYRDIMLTAWGELGPIKLVEALDEAREAAWAYYALRFVSTLDSGGMATLLAILTNANHPVWARATLHHVSDLTEQQQLTLAKIVACSNDETELAAMSGCPRCRKYLMGRW